MIYFLDIETFVAEYKEEAGTELWDKIQRMIEKSYVVIVLLTINGVKSEWVKREVTMAKTLDKKFIPIVESGVKDEIPIPLRGLEYIQFLKENPIETIEKVCFRLKDLKKNDLGFSMNC
jgi:hypothetical protein